MSDEHPNQVELRFSEDPRTGVFICKHVAEGAPVLYAAHDSDGDWQFLCGQPHDEAAGERPMLVCLVDVVARDPSLNAVAEIAENHYATRDAPENDWVVVDEAEAFVERCVEEFGWAVEIVPEGDTEDQPAFAYTVGLMANFGHPELIVFGLEGEDMHTILNSLGERVKAGETLAVGAPISDVLEGGVQVMLRPVADPKSYDDHVGYAIAYYEGRDFPLLQLVWPDEQGRFPGEEGVDPVVATAQPLLA
jgi:hypothetical protein